MYDTGNTCERENTMNLQTMEYFSVLARERSFTRAAAALHITQQSLSGHIAAGSRSWARSSSPPSSASPANASTKHKNPGPRHQARAGTFLSSGFCPGCGQQGAVQCRGVGLPIGIFGCAAGMV